MGPCLILEGMKHQHQLNIPFRRYVSIDVAIIAPTHSVEQLHIPALPNLTWHKKNNHTQQLMPYCGLKRDLVSSFKIHLVNMQLVLEEAQAAMDQY